MSEGSSSAVLVLQFLMAEIDAGGLRVRRNVLGTPYLESAEPVFRSELYGRRTREWLSALLFRKLEVPPGKSDWDRILSVVAGNAEDCVIVDEPELLKLIESEPVIAVAIEFIDSQPTHAWEGTMDPLWKLWSTFAHERGLSRLKGNQFPGGGQALSRKLRPLAPKLRLLGIDVSFRRSGRRVTIRRMDDNGQISSSVSSIDKSSATEELRHADDDEAILHELDVLQTTLHPNPGVSP